MIKIKQNPCIGLSPYSQAYKDCISNTFRAYEIKTTTKGTTSPQCPSGTTLQYLSPDANGNYPSGDIYIPYSDNIVNGNQKAYCVKVSTSIKPICPTGTTKNSKGLCETNNPTSVEVINPKTSSSSESLIIPTSNNLYPQSTSIPKIPKSQTSTTSQVIPTSNNQYPSESIPKTPESQTSSTSQASIQNLSMLSRIYDFVSLYRDYFIGFLIVAMVIVVLIGKGKKHE